VNEAIADLYDGLLDDSAWPGILAAIARVFDAQTAYVRISNGGDVPTGCFLALYGYSPSDIDEYAQSYAHEDYWALDGTAKLQPGVPAVGDQLTSRDKIERTSVFTDFCARFDVKDILVMPVERRGDVVSMVGVNGRGEDGRFGEAHLELARLLQTHLQQAILLRHRLGGPDDRVVGARLEAQGVGMGMFDRNGRLVYETDTFTALAAVAGVFGAAGRERAAEASPDIRRLMDRALATGAGGRLIIRAGGMGTMLIRCSPLPVHPWVVQIVEAPGVMVTLELLDPGFGVALDAAAELWRLTPRERQVLHALSAAKSVIKAVETLGIRHETVRTHARNIYSKAGVHSLAELLTAAAAVPIIRD
jgi:DNA-binding CsgD family transcriptional regulator